MMAQLSVVNLESRPNPLDQSPRVRAILGTRSAAASWILGLGALLFATATGCSRGGPGSDGAVPPKNLLIVTIDTLRADRVGAYGYGAARTPAIDALAERGVRFTHAYASAPITLTSHATIMTGRYPPGHGARHNGMRLDLAVPTLADTLSHAGFRTAAFVGAFPLDRRFGLIKGFRTYGDQMPRIAGGGPANERPGRMVVDDAIEWLASNRAQRFFLWVHLFEPHAPYGNPGDRRPAQARYDDEVAEADRQTGRLLEALGSDASSTIVILAADHGEAFGEHGEIGHSIFIYDTTLRVPLVIAPPAAGRRVVDDVVGLVDVAPTVTRLLGVTGFDSDGIDLSPALDGRALPDRSLYAESFAPLLDFGWSPLRSIRAGGFKYIAAPEVELYRVASDGEESTNLATKDSAKATELDGRVNRVSSAALTNPASADPEAAARLQALGYTSGRDASRGTARPDPKSRRELAARIAQVTSGELQGPQLEEALQLILKDDPQNAQAHLRLGFLLAAKSQCADAEPHFRAAIEAHMPTADAHIGLAACQASSRRFREAAATLEAAETVEPDNPVVVANRGVVLSDGGQAKLAIPLLQRALTLDPEFLEARFNLAVAFARAGQREEALRQANELLRRLPEDAPQRPEVERLVTALR